ncbi:MAG: transcriptional repressor NrdR [Lachnospiraceae bacterium]|nr:transcriptional repressor NrdR [Lachnospiraceae bacterium]
MKCPYCGEDGTRVVDSRPSDDNSAIRRRRQCESCQRRFTTYEKQDIFPVMVIKKDENRELYSRDKVKSGIVMACHKRPISTETLNQLVDEVENAIFAMDVKEVPSSMIGEMVMDKLKALDKVAYVRFASVYRSFTDVNTFAEELKMLLQKEN